jgi:hypothetical protein
MMKLTHATPTPPRRGVLHLATDRRAIGIASLLLGAALSGCGSGTPPLQLSGGTVGDLESQPPDPSIQSKHFVVDSSQGGLAGSVNIVSTYWGRIVDIIDSDTSFDSNGLPKPGSLQQKDMVIGENIQTDLVDFKLTTNPVTSVTTVQILHPYIATPPPGQPPGGTLYSNAFKKLELGIVQITPKGDSPADLPPFTLAPRNAALVVKFNDLIDANTITTSSVRLLTGNPPIVAMEPRILMDQNHGDLADFNGDGVLEFHTTRVIITPVVNDLDAAASNPPLPVNAIGLPASLTNNLPNVIVRIPTVPDASSGQTTVLSNPSGGHVAFTNNGPNDNSTPTMDVVRAFRSGNSADVHNGFLLDLEPPQVVGVQQAALNLPSAQDGLPSNGSNFRLAFVVPFCMSPVSPLKVGDVLRQSSTGVYAQITNVADPLSTQNVIIAGPNPTADKKYNYKIILTPTGGVQTLVLGATELSTVFNPTTDTHQACFVRFSSVVQEPAAGQPPLVGTDSSITVRFSEPMDPATIKAFDTQTVTRVASAPNAKQFVVGEISPSSDSKDFAYTHGITVGFPFAHMIGTSESYFLNLSSGPSGPTDLAGNPLQFPLPQIEFKIDPTAPTQSNAGVVLRFNSLAENPNGLDTAVPPILPDIRGQFLIDTAHGLLRPRSVTRFSAAADRTQPVPSVMVPFGPGVQTPLSGLGSKLQALWRYCDVGFGLLDETTTNVDVENIDWAPKGGSAIADHYTRFEMVLSHSFFLPDEISPPPNLLPLFPASGLVTLYASNYLDPTNDPPKVVHNRNLGYNLNPADLFLSEHGVPMVPWPLNRTIPMSQFAYYTWRDTSIQTVAGPNNGGAELAIVGAVGGGAPAGTFATGMIPTIGLPLLMEYRCFPDNEATGLNSFDISIATNSSPQPNFRAFSTGGVVGSTVHIKDPDLEDVADGGFNPNSTPPGATTPGVDNSFYIGQLDLVVRVSRAHTIWFETGSSSPTYSAPVVEPLPEDQPLGSQLLLSFRGATMVQGAGDPLLKDASQLDAYGDPQKVMGVPVGVVTFFHNDKTWKSSLSQLQGASLFQVRVTFLANSQTNLVPLLSALGFAFQL